MFDARVSLQSAALDAARARLQAQQVGTLPPTPPPVVTDVIVTLSAAALALMADRPRT